MGKAGVDGASGVPPFLLFPFGAFRSAPSGKGRSLGAPRETSREVGLGRSRQFSPNRAGGAGAGAGHGRWGEQPLGGRGGGRGGRGLSAFSLSARPVSLFSAPKSRSFRRRNGVLSANYRRLNGDRFVALSSQSSPFRRLFRPGAFPTAYTRVGGFFGGRDASPLCRAKVPKPPLRRFALAKFSASPCESPRPPLRRFALAKFSASPCESPWPHFAASPRKSTLNHPVFRFAVANFRSSPW